MGLAIAEKSKIPINNDNHYQLESTGNDIYLKLTGQVPSMDLLRKTYFLPVTFLFKAKRKALLIKGCKTERCPSPSNSLN
jgi:hypothetical protein